MILYWISLLIGIVLLIWYIREKLTAYTVRELILKTLTSVCFMMMAIVGAWLVPMTAPARSFAYFILAGLLLGLLGDVWLDLKYVYPDDDTVYTYAGFYSFFAGHILFILGMIINFGDSSRVMYIILPIILGLAAGVATGLLGKVMNLDYGRYRTTVMGYGGILISMALLAGSLALMHHGSEPTLNVMFIGGILFAVSDLVLSQTYFAGNESKPVIIANYMTYYPAQFLIATSLLFLR